MKIMVFDLDNTIYDRSIPYLRAFNEFFNNAYPVDLMHRAYVRCNVRGMEVFADSQAGRISMEEMYIYRFKNGLADVGIEITPADALKIQAAYKKYQGVLELSPTMARVLDVCRDRFDRIAILTNGPSVHQREKAACLGMDRWFKESDIFVSGDIGSLIKPDIRVFEYASSNLQASPEDLWMIGDSYPDDIVGAMNAHWRTIWLNRTDLPLPEGSTPPDHEVRSEEELYQLLSTL